ncbi:MULTISPECIES: potassium channel family protein [unclassified Streptomyces]|uniref:potassium channel family protein n=1 Tax=unclassified Streptomyces TaxID=2593676 RepID=UPI0022B747E0|nr:MULTISPECIES: potassium channel family protein [unclassified Streptomyces]MCZ7413180.1 potassium channel family protein [Streptomyces sp. WMMC897]MCZ7417786.1 potassium channel family protein [Streptomyces sp. WMMC897]MCZ7432418.1 potassium channel family protein [Streptomyces sp. WMMC1477]
MKLRNPIVTRRHKLTYADDYTFRVQLPRQLTGPLIQVAKRLLMAHVVLLVAVLIVYLDRDGYVDNVGDGISLLDAIYYVTVSLSTTGYGDIYPASEAARLLTTFAITPLRILFLIILVGTSLEVLTERTRQQWRLSHWRSTVRDHTVIVGFGTKGRSAAETLLSAGATKEQIVVVDPSAKVIDAANADGFAGVVGDATRSSVLERARIDRARRIIIATQRDDTAVLVTLTARQLNRKLNIVASVREEENVPLLRQSGADSVVTSSGAAGRLLGLSLISPSAGQIMEDLIQTGIGMTLAERPVTKAEAGRSPRECPDLVLAVIRGHRLLHFDDPAAATLQPLDRVVVIRRAHDEQLVPKLRKGDEDDTGELRNPPRMQPPKRDWQAPRDDLGQ